MVILSIPITIIWIIGITNAINLIDGLDGLAAGVSTIALITLSIMAIIMGESICYGNSSNTCGKFTWIFVFQLSSSKNFHGGYGIVIPRFHDFRSCAVRI